MRAAELPRTCELVASLKGAPRSYFKNFVASLRDNAIKRKYFVDMEAELAALDPAAWDHLRTKVGPLFMRKEKVRGWQGAFSELNEAKAYNFLIRSGCTSVEFIPCNRDAKTPDLRAKLGNVDVLCEAKTINRSERAIVAQLRRAASSVPILLGKEFFAKIASTIKHADRQMAAFSSALDTKRIIHVVINFDDGLHEYVDGYLTCTGFWPSLLIRHGAGPQSNGHHGCECHESRDSTLLTPSGASLRPSRMIGAAWP